MQLTGHRPALTNSPTAVFNIFPNFDNAAVLREFLRYELPADESLWFITMPPMPGIITQIADDGNSATSFEFFEVTGEKGFFGTRLARGRQEISPQHQRAMAAAQPGDWLEPIRMRIYAAVASTQNATVCGWAGQSPNLTSLPPARNTGFLGPPPYGQKVLMTVIDKLAEPAQEHMIHGIPVPAITGIPFAPPVAPPLSPLRPVARARARSLGSASAPAPTAPIQPPPGPIIVQRRPFEQQINQFGSAGTAAQFLGTYGLPQPTGRSGRTIPPPEPRTSEAESLPDPAGYRHSPILSRGPPRQRSQFGHPPCRAVAEQFQDVPLPTAQQLLRSPLREPPSPAVSLAAQSLGLIPGVTVQPVNFEPKQKPKKAPKRLAKETCRPAAEKKERSSSRPTTCPRPTSTPR